MGERTCDIAVIGAGTAGLKAYKAARERGADVLLIERGPGGSTCTRTGCMPSKLLLAAANRAAAVRDAPRFGIMPGDSRIDEGAVLARLHRERDRFVESVLAEFHAIPESHRIHGAARFVAPTRLAVGNDTIAARAIIIATGATPVIPGMLDPVRALVRTHETIFDIDALPESLAVLGAGPVGIELAQAFARLGVAVTVIDEGRTIGGMSDPVANDAAHRALSAELTLHLGVKATAAADGQRAKLHWQGEAPGSVTVDLILAATGRPPNLESLDLKAAGLALDDDGVPLFDRRTHRCGDSSVFLAGDAGSWRPVLHEAARGGTVAGTVAAGGEAPRPWPRFAMTFTEPNLVEVGTPLADLPEGARIGEAQLEENGRATIEGHGEGIVRLYADADGALLGAAIVAAGGEHLGHMVALALDRGMTVADLADLPWYHPTIEETLQMAARRILGDA